MIQVIKKTKIDGVVHETTMSFSDNEWKLIQKHYPSDGVSFVPIPTAKVEDVVKDIDKPGRAEDDDKPKMKDYSDLKDAGMRYFKEENWDRAIYYFEEAHKLKSFGWLNGKIAQCKKNAGVEHIAKKTHKPIGRPRKG